jgi:hypothetical protein
MITMMRLTILISRVVEGLDPERRGEVERGDEEAVETDADEIEDNGFQHDADDLQQRHGQPRRVLLAPQDGGGGCPDAGDGQADAGDEEADGDQHDGRHGQQDDEARAPDQARERRRRGRRRPVGGRVQAALLLGQWGVSSLHHLPTSDKRAAEREASGEQRDGAAEADRRACFEQVPCQAAQSRPGSPPRPRRGLRDGQGRAGRGPAAGPARPSRRRATTAGRPPATRRRTRPALQSLQ